MTMPSAALFKESYKVLINKAETNGIFNVLQAGQNHSACLKLQLDRVEYPSLALLFNYVFLKVAHSILQGSRIISCISVN